MNRNHGRFRSHGIATSSQDGVVSRTQDAIPGSSIGLGAEEKTISTVLVCRDTIWELTSTIGPLIPISSNCLVDLFLLQTASAANDKSLLPLSGSFFDPVDDELPLGLG